MPTYKFGDIVEASVTDPNGQNKKPRPVLILSADEDIANGDDLFVVAISSTGIPKKLPSHYFALQWHRNGHPRTGLKMPSVAKCDWRRKVPQNEVLFLRGSAPAATLSKIAEYFANLP